MTKDQIRTIFMQRGFTIKEGQDDLKDYVYEAANDLIRARDEEARALLADGGKGEAQPIDILLDRLKSGGDYTTPLTTPQAECAPREAQPEPESACNPADICAGCRCEYSQSAAPTPERADAETAVAWQPIETAPKDGRMFLGWVNAVQYGESDEGRQFEADVSDHDFCQWRDHGGYFENMMGRVGDASHITHWMPLPAAPSTAAGASERADADTAGAWTYDQVVMLCETDGVPLPVDFIEWVAEKMTRAANEAFIAAGASQERADAGKDAALLEALRKIAAIENKMYGGDWDEIEEARSIASIAILAANKEPK
jgi:hypothetical protein